MLATISSLLFIDKHWQLEITWMVFLAIIPLSCNLILLKETNKFEKTFFFEIMCVNLILYIYIIFSYIVPISSKYINELMIFTLLVNICADILLLYGSKKKKKSLDRIKTLYFNSYPSNLMTLLITFFAFNVISTNKSSYIILIMILISLFYLFIRSKCLNLINISIIKYYIKINLSIIVISIGILLFITYITSKLWIIALIAFIGALIYLKKNKKINSSLNYCISFYSIIIIFLITYFKDFENIWIRHPSLITNIYVTAIVLLIAITFIYICNFVKTISYQNCFLATNSFYLIITVINTFNSNIHSVVVNHAKSILLLFILILISVCIIKNNVVDEKKEFN